MTGNTHRTEFCIDKMYAPESSSGRLGLVEFRALEMPPHARMSAAQMLLMRSAIAAFWESPYERRLVRWGTRLHDEFMLPHYVEQDFARRAARRWRSSASRWMRTGSRRTWNSASRCRRGDAARRQARAAPRAGALARAGRGAGQRRHGALRRQLDRTAAGAGERLGRGTLRAGLQRLRGAADPTETEGEYVGGVRFKAWEPPQRALHPTIPAQTPLIFDMYDRWTGRSLGGLTHHVAHPGGRSYETLPGERQRGGERGAARGSSPSAIRPVGRRAGAPAGWGGRRRSSRALAGPARPGLAMTSGAGRGLKLAPNVRFNG